MHLVNVKNRRIFKNDSAGDRTQNLWFRRPAPYPLGHEVVLLTYPYIDIFILNYLGLPKIA